MGRVNLDKNKRRAYRSPCTVPVDSKDGGDFDQTLTTDISKGGLGFFSKCEVPIGKEITIELDFQEKDDPVFVVGQVRWIRYIEEECGYRMGLTFKEVLRGSKERLKKYFRKESVRRWV